MKLLKRTWSVLRFMGVYLVANLQAAMEYRTAFVLYHQHGQPYEEIALALDHPVGTIKTWLHRARMQVLEQLRNRGMVPEEYGIES